MSDRARTAVTTRLRSLPLPVKRAAQRGTVAYGRGTRSARAKPSVLIVGAQRSGTTSMYRALAQHPAVIKSRFHKGVHYFDTNYDRGVGWYVGHFPTRRRLRSAAKEAGVPAVTFESSPYYMCHPLAPARIAADLQDVRLIVLLRDPVERAYSAHSHELARSFETQDFRTALALEDERLRGEEERLRAEPGYVSHSHQHHAYRSRGEYVTYLRRLERLVGRSRMHVVDSHNFFTEPQPVFAEVLRFLSLPDHPNTSFDRHNARSRLPLDHDLRVMLEEHYRPWNDELAAWWGRAPSWLR